MVHLFQMLSKYSNGLDFLNFLNNLFLFPQASTGSVIYSFVIWYLLYSETLWEISKHSQKHKVKVPAPFSGMNYYCVQFIKIRIHVSPTFCCEICKLPRLLLTFSNFPSPHYLPSFVPCGTPVALSATTPEVSWRHLPAFSRGHNS